MKKYTLKGNSMYPFLKEMDVCIAAETSAEKIRVGDVVAYSSSGGKTPVVHRVVGIDAANRKIFVKGDNQDRGLAEKIPFENVAAKIIRVGRAGKSFDFVSNTSVFRNRLIAYLSRYDLTPYMVYKRCMVPIALFFMRTRCFSFVRTFFYRSFELVVSRQKEGLKIHLMSRGHKAADIMLHPYGVQKLDMASYVRIRDRNPFFIVELLGRVAHCAESSFGHPVEIQTSDPVVVPFLDSVNTRLKKDSKSRFLNIS